MNVRQNCLVAFATIALALAPNTMSSWGTMTSKAKLTWAESFKLKNFLEEKYNRDLYEATSEEERGRLQRIANYLAGFWTTGAEDRFIADLEVRKGPHPLHQFIAHKAYQLLEMDPALSDGKSGFPDISLINTWDGIYRLSDSRGEHVYERDESNDVGAAFGKIVPDKPTGSFPSADAEVTLAGNWNGDYNGNRHYWNPWLKIGGAPDAAAHYYLELVRAIAYASQIDGDDELERWDLTMKGKFAAYMAHYIGDVASAKHADAIAIGSHMGDLKRLANSYHKAMSDMSLWEGRDDPNQWLARAEIKEARTILNGLTFFAARKAGDESMHEKYWKRLYHHVPENMLLQPGSGWWTYMTVDVMEQSVDSVIAAFLWNLAERPSYRGSTKSDSFYDFFDPFYFNGPMLDKVHAMPSFDVTVAGSGHVFWESNPGHLKHVLANYGPTTGAVEPHYAGFAVTKNYASTITSEREAAMTEMARNLVDACSVTAHGDICTHEDIRAACGHRDFDYGPNGFQDHLQVAIDHVFTAFRASVSAMRIEEGSIVNVGTEGEYKVKCKVRNLAKHPVTMNKLKLFFRDDRHTVPRSFETLEYDMSGVVIPAGGAVEVEDWQIEDKYIRGLDMDFWVDAYGIYSDIPDSGWRRDRIERKGAYIRSGAGSLTNLPASGPVDIVVVFDVTGSMGGAIDDMRAKAQSIITSLKNPIGEGGKGISDLRLALVGFRDIEADGGSAFTSSGFTDNLQSQFNVMDGWIASGGGDTPEDQIEGIMIGLNFWVKEEETGAAEPDRKPTKIVVVITDAPAKSPDHRSRTFQDVADLAEAVDPAHIYPIILGSDPIALEHASKIAKLTSGLVLPADDPGKVADAFLAAVETAIAEHGTPSGGFEWPWAEILFFGGLGAILFGTVVVFRTRK